MTKREFLDTVFALAPNEANAIMDAFDDVVAVFKMLKAAYDVLTEWMEGREVTE